MNTTDVGLEVDETRGAVHLRDLTVDVSSLKDRLESMNEDDWVALGYGEQWNGIELFKPDGRGGLTMHPLVQELPILEEIVDTIPSECLDLSLARLGPGGWIKEHRDLSGGVPMGVARFHIPVTTNERVEFFVSGNRVQMGVGEVWSLDTSYRHRVANRGASERIHLIGDFHLNDAIREMLPSRDWRDRLHDVSFFAVCVGHGLVKTAKDPAAGFRRLRQFVGLKFLKRSQMGFGDD